MSGIHILMINPNDGSETPDDVFRYNVPNEFQMGKHRLSGEVIECSLRELTGVDETFIICRVCFKYMHQPTTLSCLHAFCLECIFECTRDYGMVCPLCTQRFTAPMRDLARIPKNSFIYHNICVAVAGQEIDNAPCKICNLKPDEFCQDCDAFLCELCSIVCHKMNGKTNHDSMLLSKYKKLVTSKQPSCVDHNTNVNGFCEECKELVCEKCDGHEKHTMKDVDYGIAYFRKATDDLLVRYPYEKSLLYKTRKERGEPLYTPTQIEPNRYKYLNTRESAKCCKQTLSKEQIDQLKIDLQNKTLPSRLSADKTMRISSFQTKDMNWDVFVPQTGNPFEGKTPMDGPALAERLLSQKPPPLPINDPKKLAELLQCTSPPIAIETPQQLAELLKTNKSLLPITDQAMLAELLESRKIPMPMNDPVKMAELLQCKSPPIEIETPQQLAELLKTNKTLLPITDRAMLAELLESQKHAKPMDDLMKKKNPPKQLDTPEQIIEFLESRNLPQSFGDLLKPFMADKSRQKEQVVQLNFPDDIKAKLADFAAKASQPGNYFDEEKMMLNHVMGMNSVTPPPDKSPKPNFHDIDFDDVD